jgi:hypothetical protein
MTDEIVYVVGDKFEDFGKNERVVTIGELERQIADGSDENMFSDNRVFVAGQGLQPERVASMREAITAAGYPHRADSLRLDELADQSITHKQSSQNTMITAPRQVNDRQFVAKIQLNDLCAEMADHMTGQHIQGIVLVEAARQMFLAVVSSFLLDPKRGSSYYFVVNRLDVSYLNFAFPLPLDINFNLIERGVDSAGNLSIEAQIEIVQACEKVCEVTARFAIYRSAMMKMIEGMRANDTLNRCDKQQQTQNAVATTIA